MLPHPEINADNQTRPPPTADLPFATIADPDKRYYREFGVESSPRAILDPRSWGAIAHGLTAALQGKLRRPTIRRDGGHFGLPADFLIDTGGRVIAAKYGKHATTSGRSMSCSRTPEGTND